MRIAAALVSSLLSACAAAPMTGPPATAAQRAEYRSVVQIDRCIDHLQTEMNKSRSDAVRACACAADVVEQRYTVDEMAVSIRYWREQHTRADAVSAMQSVARVAPEIQRRCGI